MIVRAGSPLKAGIAPLLPTKSWTIEGSERFGGSRVPTGGAGACGGGRRPAGLGSNLVSRVHPRSRGPRLSHPPNGRRGLSGASLSNLSGGSNAAFRVGDHWQLNLTGGQPGANVYLNATVCSPDFSRCAQAPMSGQKDIAFELWTGKSSSGYPPVGTTDANGNFTMSGVFTPDQVGMWTQLWNVGGVLMGLPQFTVADANGSAVYQGPVTPGGTPYYTQASDHPPTQPAPTAQVMTLDQQLAARGIALPGSTPTGPAASGGGVVKAGSVAFTNITSGNASQFRVGDSWRVSISGASPNQPIVVTGVQNGKSSTTQLGVTDASGAWTSTGTMDASTVGNWTESWSVGGVPAAQLSFTVGSGSGSSAAQTPADTFDVGSVLGGSLIGGIPNWALLAAGLGLVFVLGGHHRG